MSFEDAETPIVGLRSFASKESNDRDTGKSPGILLTDLAELPDRALLNEERLADLLEVAPRTIRRMRNRFEIPPPVRIAGRSMWFAGRVLDYIEEHARSLEEDSRKNSKRLRRI